MNKNYLFLGISAISLVLMGLVVFNPFTGNSRVNGAAAGDFYQRHPDWIWTTNRQNALIPTTRDAAFPDYFQRHPELAGIAANGSGASDYFERHPELIQSSKQGVDTSDYFLRHSELNASAADAPIDVTDYYFRHLSK
jgi:hypothetical protein